jgi:hypothetical protein
MVRRGNKAGEESSFEGGKEIRKSFIPLSKETKYNVCACALFFIAKFHTDLSSPIIFLPSAFFLLASFLVISPLFKSTATKLGDFLHFCKI